MGLRGKKKEHTEPTTVFMQQGEVRAVFCWLVIVFYCCFCCCCCFLKLALMEGPSLVMGKGPLTQTCWHLLPLMPMSPPVSSASVGLLLLLSSSLQEPLIKTQLWGLLVSASRLGPTHHESPGARCFFLRQLPSQKATLKRLSRKWAPHYTIRSPGFKYTFATWP